MTILALPGILDQSRHQFKINCKIKKNTEHGSHKYILNPKLMVPVEIGRVYNSAKKIQETDLKAAGQ
jgi:hypothetical protein